MNRINRTIRIAGLSALVLVSACFTHHHYVDDATKLDYYYFGTVDPKESATVALKAFDSWQSYYLFGFEPWNEESVTFAADTLAKSPASATAPRKFQIQTRKSFLNGLAETGLRLIPFVGWVTPFFVNWWEVEVTAEDRK